MNKKYDIQVKTKDKAARIPKEVISRAKMGLSTKMIAAMKKEIVDCPLVKEGDRRLSIGQGRGSISVLLYLPIISKEGKGCSALCRYQGSIW